MVTEVKLNNTPVAGDQATRGVGKVQPVNPAKPVQDLPDDGKKVPQGEGNETKAALQAGKLDDVVRELNDHVQHVQRELQFSVDEDSGRTVIKVLDKETKDVIRQIPGEEALNFARKLDEGAELEIFSAFTQSGIKFALSSSMFLVSHNGLIRIEHSVKNVTVFDLNVVLIYRGN